MSERTAVAAILVILLAIAAVLSIGVLGARPQRCAWAITTGNRHVQEVPCPPGVP